MACPMCRSVEKKMTPNEFKCFYPDMYHEWIQLELNCDEDGFSYYYQYTKPFNVKKSFRNKEVKQYSISKPVMWNRKLNIMKGKRKI
jgi:hypothetical protein